MGEKKNDPHSSISNRAQKSYAFNRNLGGENEDIRAEFEGYRSANYSTLEWLHLTIQIGVFAFAENGRNPPIAKHAALRSKVWVGLISLKKSLVFGVARLATALILLNDRC
ncbi:hypothetical protein [Falsiruegeria mediterranea]|uniref:Uncharacterized protein n=1 Tax=Falsiruegeria mediterranea M17 TaxID=1200281 RepID=A0A2R8CGE3_9RHOB|nr:hypothetical protein [Falsiruegeria mediterranea]SPJ31514.1 hypothetical protein TRM7615_05057 [Falsiruegeria mediterranea M17]